MPTLQEGQSNRAFLLRSSSKFWCAAWWNIHPVPGIGRCESTGARGLVEKSPEPTPHRKTCTAVASDATMPVPTP